MCQVGPTWCPSQISPVHQHLLRLQKNYQVHFRYHQDFLEEGLLGEYFQRDQCHRILCLRHQIHQQNRQQR